MYQLNTFIFNQNNVVVFIKVFKSNKNLDFIPELGTHVCSYPFRQKVSERRHHVTGTS